MSDPGVGGRRGPGVGLVLAAAGSALLVVGLAVVILLLVRGPAGDGADTVATPTSGAATTSVVDGPPGVIEECSDSGEAVLPRSGRGTEATSCAFAVAVRDAYFRTARPGDPAMVEADSPTTGQSYEMGCIDNHNNGGIICRGGDNAVVYLY